MKCPFCFHDESKVIDSRPTDEGEKIRRRRECLQCMKRFTTYEVIETAPIMVIKKDKSREAFNRDKLLVGLLRACEKRPVSMQTLEETVDAIQTSILNTMDREIQSSVIGELAMARLKDIDEVAYVRFASVYRQFKDINSFMDELKSILEAKQEDS
ncbi:MAG: transcriptional regulator NrdR [Oscillospiraceae bacterium]|jgi:transcriptional repressor NrdR|nr:transcriptional regulator NrdR [Oscillospiraceae bacterium]